MGRVKEMLLRRFLVALGTLLSFPLMAQGTHLTFVRYATMENPPFVIADNSQPSGVTGLYADILNDVISKRMGLSWNCVLLPWKRAQTEVQSGTADLIITVPTEERLIYSIPSDQPVFETYLHVYTYKGHPKLQEIRRIKSVEDIRRLGLVPVTNLGNNWHRENIDSAGVPTHYAPADDNIARILAAKRADIMIDLPFTMDPMIKSLGLSRQIEMTPARFGPIRFHILVSRKSSFTQSMDALNLAIDRFIQEGTRDRLIEKWARR